VAQNVGWFMGFSFKTCNFKTATGREFFIRLTRGVLFSFHMPPTFTEPEKYFLLIDSKIFGCFEKL
jgi:hypothetical protein